MRYPETTTRFCPICSAEVEAADGFCLLGHSLKLESAVSGRSELQAAVDKAFEEARAEVASALADSESAPDPVAAIHEQRASLYSSLREDIPLGAGDPIAAFAPPPRMDWGPNRGRSRTRRFGFRRALEEAAGS